MFRAGGYSLLEMLVVVVVVLSLASIAWGRYGNLEREEATRLAAVQLDQLATAIRAFKTDTGYWPGEGPFALEPAGASLTTGIVLRDSLPDIALPLVGVDSDIWDAAWHAHPGNLWQLFARPDLDASKPLGRLKQWDDASQRGWRGPYLDAGKLKYVDLGIDDPLEAGLVQRDLPNLPAGYALPPLDPECTPDQPCVYRWTRKASAFEPGDEDADYQYARAGRPLLYFGPVYGGRVRIAHPGDDGRFGGLSATAPCLPATNDAGIDDLVRCLD